MITEIDIQRIMNTQRELTESVADPSYSGSTQDVSEDEEVLEMMGVELSVSETNGLL